MGRSEGSGSLPSEFFISSQHQTACVSMATRYSRTRKKEPFVRQAIERLSDEIGSRWATPADHPTGFGKLRRRMVDRAYLDSDDRPDAWD